MILSIRSLFPESWFFPTSADFRIIALLPVPALILPRESLSQRWDTLDGFGTCAVGNAMSPVFARSLKAEVYKLKSQI